jgi:hypothetical protein
MSINEILHEKSKSNIFTKKEICYYIMIDKFFNECTDNQIKKMLDIINKESEISLRILDWFVTRYSKKRIDLDIGSCDDIFDVHISYKAQLKSYKKTYFDPFRRRKKFFYNYDKKNQKKNVYTTLGQLNFFRWAISNNIIEYVEKNLSQLTKAMNSSNKEDKKKKNSDKSESENDDDSYDDNDNKNTNDEHIYESSNSSKSINSSESSKSHKTIKNKLKKTINIKNKKINISASEDILDNEVQIIINFD